MILLGVRLRQRAAEHREVLGEDVDDAAVDGAPAGDHAVAGDLGLLHAEVGAAVLDVHVELLEGVLVHQQVDALARGQLAALVLGVDARLAAAEPRLRPPPLQLFETSFMATPRIRLHSLNSAGVHIASRGQNRKRNEGLIGADQRQQSARGRLGRSVRRRRARLRGGPSSAALISGAPGPPHVPSVKSQPCSASQGAVTDVKLSSSISRSPAS